MHRVVIDSAKKVIVLEDPNSPRGIWLHNADNSGLVAQLWSAFFMLAVWLAIPVFVATMLVDSEKLISGGGLLLLLFPLAGFYFVFESVQRFRGKWRMGSELDVASGILLWWLRGKNRDLRQLDMRIVQQICLNTYDNRHREGGPSIDFHTLPFGEVEVPVGCFGDERSFKAFLRQNYPGIEVVD